jgi:hypothetical protein
MSKFKPKWNQHDNRQQKDGFPRHYESMEVCVFSAGVKKTRAFLRKPWDILASGIRQKDIRGNPQLNQWNEIESLFPAQVEIGCGPSVEAGIPPLHFLHSAYKITDRETGKILSLVILLAIRMLVLNSLQKCTKGVSWPVQRVFTAYLKKCMTQGI